MTERLLRTLTLLVLTALTAGCSYVRYYRDYDPAVDFGSYRTFAIPEARATTGDDPRGLSTLDAARVADGLERALIELGLEPTEPARADLRVDFRFTTEEQLDIDTWGPVFTGGYGYWNPGLGFYGGAGAQQISVQQRTQGTLLVDLIDRDRGVLVWRGWAVRDVEHLDDLEPDERRAEFAELASGILAEYPPDED